MEYIGGEVEYQCVIVVFELRPLAVVTAKSYWAIPRMERMIRAWNIQWGRSLVIAAQAVLKLMERSDERY